MTPGSVVSYRTDRWFVLNQEQDHAGMTKLHIGRMAHGWSALAT